MTIYDAKAGHRGKNNSVQHLVTLCLLPQASTFDSDKYDK